MKKDEEENYQRYFNKAFHFFYWNIYVFHDGGKEKKVRLDRWNEARRREDRERSRRKEVEKREEKGIVII